MHMTALTSPWLFWTGYALLAGGAFALWLPWLAWLLPPALLLGWLLRRVTRIRESDSGLGVTHAQWQLNTFWIFALLFLALLALLFGLGVAFSEGKALDSVEAVGNAYNAGQIDIYAAVERVWAINEIRYFTYGGMAWSLLALLWPLKRAIHGMFALAARCEPCQLASGRRLISLLLAMGLQTAALLLLRA